jgi:hypothetical protein
MNQWLVTGSMIENMQLETGSAYRAFPITSAAHVGVKSTPFATTLALNIKSPLAGS